MTFLVASAVVSVSKEDSVNRKRLIAGFAILAALVILIVFVKWRMGQPQANHRSPVSKLAYCSSSDIKPCIVSFSLDSDRNMLVNVLTPGPSFPSFYLKIRQSKDESIYECQKAEKFPANVYCTGDEMRPGQVLQFMIISKNEDTLLAEGSFAIIGLALATPEFALPTSSDEPTASPTQGLVIETAAPTKSTPRPPTPPPSTSSPSYPNPSYSNPSYP